MGSLGQHIARTTMRNLLCGALLVGSFFTVAHLAPSDLTYAPHEVARTESVVAQVVAAHDCWTNEAPAKMRGVIPGHVVVTVNGVTSYRGAAMVGNALEQIFDGADHGLTVHAFCV